MKRSFVERTMSFFITICLIPFLIFTALFVNKTSMIEKQQMEDSLTAIVEEKASTLQKDLKSIEKETENLALWASFLMKEEGEVGTGITLPPDYYRDERGVLCRKEELAHGKSSIFLPNDMVVTPEIAGDIVRSENLEVPMASILQHSSDITYAYLVTDKGFLRVFPYLNSSVFAPNHDQRSDYFYTSAVGEDNPEQKTVWTNPYYDYGGKGWIITCSRPFYIEGVFGGVVCIDVSLQRLAASVADFRMGRSGFTFVLTSSEEVIYHPKMMNFTSKRGNRLKADLTRRGNPSKDYDLIISEMTEGKQGVKTYLNEHHEYSMIAYAPIPAMDWSIGIEVDKSEYAVDSIYLTIGFWVLAGTMLLVYLVMAYGLSRRITLPIQKLTSHVRQISDGKFQQVQVTSADEIGLLGAAFNQMSREIRDYTASLLHSKHQMETLLNSIGGIMMILAPDYTISMINKEGLVRLACSDEGRLKGKKCHALFYGQNQPCKNCPMVGTLKDHLPHSRESIHGQNIYEISTYPIFDEMGEIKEIVVHSKKITEQVMMERELFQSEKMAGVGQMVAGVTHELKNPLAVIKGAIYLCRENWADRDMQNEAINEIAASVNRAERIIYNMLDFSRTSWKQKEQIKVISLLEQILLLVRQDTVKRKINVNIASEDEPAYIYGNGDSFKHIFLNVITNGIEAISDGGELKIDIRKKGEAKTEIAISNTGETIADEHLSKIFQPFFTTKENGTGLGLWIVSKEVAENGGTIEASNGQMTKITILLPGKESVNEENIDD